MLPFTSIACCRTSHALLPLSQSEKNKSVFNLRLCYTTVLGMKNSFQVLTSLYGDLLYMNPQEENNQLRSENAELMSTLAKVQADHAAIKDILKNVDNEHESTMTEAQNEVQKATLTIHNLRNFMNRASAKIEQLQSEVAAKDDQLLNNAISNNISFIQLIMANINYVRYSPWEIKLILTAGLGHKISKKLTNSNKNKHSNEKKENSAIFSLEDKTNLPVPEKTNHQAVVEISATPPPPIQRIKFFHTMWFPFPF